MSRFNSRKLFIWAIAFVCLLCLIPCLFANAEDTSDGESENYGVVIGIDLGTTFSCVAVFKNGRVEILPNDMGHRITPSYVAFTPDERLIGDAAKSQFATNPKQTIFDVKRLIGRRFDEPEVQADIKNFPFKVINKDGKPVISVIVNGKPKTLTPEEISSMILSKMKDIAESYLGHKVTHAVVTVPAYFNDQQRQATKDAGAISGLNILRIVNEPTAAAMAYGLHSKAKGERKIVVFDLGGGTFDVSLLSIEDGMFEVLATAGDTHLGGEDFDQLVIDHFVKIFNDKNNVKVEKDVNAMGKLKKEVEKAKKTLSSQTSAGLEIESFFQGHDFSESLTRARFEKLNMDLFRKTLKPVEQVLKDAGVKKTEVDDIVLVGGSTRIPKVQQMLEEYFNGKKVSKGINPDEAVAHGAAVQAAVLAGNEMVKDVVLIDLCPLTLGIETTGGVMAGLIPRNTIIPTRKSKQFTTTADNQNVVSIRIFEGERAMTKENNFLGEFELTGIPPAPRGVPQIDVTFEIDSNGILKVSAQDKGIGKVQSLTITNERDRLSAEEIERMIKEGVEAAEEDKKQLARISAKTDLEIYASNIKAQVANEEQLGGKLSPEDKSSLLNASKDTMNWLNTAEASVTVEEIEAQKDKLERLIHSITSKLYQGRNDGGAYDDYEHDEL